MIGKSRRRNEMAQLQAEEMRVHAPAKPRRRARRQSPDVRRQDLLAVTISCLARLGPRGTTGREICRQAGVSHGLLRHYFSNPENLLLETYQELCDSFIQRFAEELQSSEPDPWEALDRFFAVLFSDQWASSEILGAWMAFWALVRTRPEFAEVGDHFNGKLRALLTEAVSRLPARPGRLPITDVAALLSAVMDGLWLDFCLSPTRLPRDRALELCSLALRQLVPVEA
jgi:AcrR family transcriptional regulator